ncbi:MAG: HD-GYP domain-containing protein [Bacteriovoracia bacterium]
MSDTDPSTSPAPASAAEQAHQDALEKTFAGRLKETVEGYYEVPTVLFVNKIDLGMAPLPDIAFFNDKDGKVEVLRQADQPYSALALSNFEKILVRTEDFGDLKRFAEQQIVSGVGKGAMPVEQRMDTLRRAAILMVEDLFNNPSPENINKSNKMVGSFVYVLMKEPEAYLHLAKLSSHDHYTLQHSVGTAVNSIILGRKAGIKNPQDLEELGLGGLLHDIGKVKVKKEIINKEGPLDEAEWDEMRQHSQWGYEIVKDVPVIKDRTKAAILEHHEDKTGGGYPRHMQWNDVHLFSKIVCISDIFNALTTNRSYSKAREPFDAFRLMREKIHHKIDDELFRYLVLIYGGQLKDLKTG